MNANNTSIFNGFATNAGEGERIWLPAQPRRRASATRSHERR